MKFLSLDTGAVTALVIVGVVVLLLIVVVGWYISTRNKFIRYEQDIESSESRIDVYLTKRYDLLTKMVATTKGYAKHESETLENIIAMRNPNSMGNVKDKQEFNNMMTEVQTKLNVVVESYPSLKADSLFKGLQESITEVEENLQAARSNFNSNVSTYNKAILQFPASIVAGSRFTKKEYFEAEEAKKQDVKIEF